MRVWEMNRREQAGAWRPVGRSRLVRGLVSQGGTTTEAIRQAEGELASAIPPSLKDFALEADAAEGWVEGEYLALWPVSRLAALNRMAEVDRADPDLVAFATNGSLEGYFFSKTTGEFVNSPMIGLGYLPATRVATSFSDFLEWLANSHPGGMPNERPDVSRLGLVIHNVQPVLFGGDPVDPKNKVLVPLEQYVQVVAWWNRRIRV